MNTKSEDRILRALDALDRRAVARPAYIRLPDPAPRYAPPPSLYCYVYFVRGGDFIKIGITDSVRSRLAAMQTGSPLPLRLVGSIRCKGREAALKAEQDLHAKFATDRVSGEWFQASHEIERYVSVHAEAP